MPSAVQIATVRKPPNIFGQYEHASNSLSPLCLDGKSVNREQLLCELERLLSDQQLVACIHSLHAILEVFSRHSRNPDTEPAEMESRLNAKDSEFMERLEQVLESEHTDPDLGLEQLASCMAMSGRQLQRKLKLIIDQQPVEYLRAYRLKRACELLRTGILVCQVADAVGFGSPAYFTCCFKTCFGLTPSEFQLQDR